MGLGFGVSQQRGELVLQPGLATPRRRQRVALLRDVFFKEPALFVYLREQGVPSEPDGPVSKPPLLPLPVSKTLSDSMCSLVVFDSVG